MTKRQELQRSRRVDYATASQTKTWIDRDLAGSEFRDARLNRRFRKLFEQLSDGTGESIPLVCQDWANTKAAYRFLSNHRVTEGDILAVHFQSTRDRFAATDATVFILHDTTPFNYHREDTRSVGIVKQIPVGKCLDGRLQHYVVCGILMHSSLAVTIGGLPLGLAAMKFWNRKKFKGCNALKKKINPTRVPIEKKESIRWLENLKQSTSLFNDPQRCVHIGDRESDVYDLFCAAQAVGTHFLVRTCVDRLAGDGKHTIADEMDEVRIKGLHRIDVRDKKGNLSKAILEIKYHRMRVLPPIGKHKQYPELMLTVIHAQERGTPQGREKIDWKLIKDLPVNSREEAIEKLRWYSMRWKIETFHKILKSGCKAEESRLRTATRLANLIAVFCILSWRIFWLTMMNRALPDASPTLAFTALEIRLLDHLAKGKGEQVEKTSVSSYLVQLARLGDYLARAGDSPPGNKVIWKGLSRLTDVEFGSLIGAKLVGN
ncbi:MAG: IS4 family transposase [Formivibrio sp.]|nr:IS4 family transposase [Formivibrio sp.]